MTIYRGFGLLCDQETNLQRGGGRARHEAALFWDDEVAAAV